MYAIDFKPEADPVISANRSRGGRDLWSVSDENYTGCSMGHWRRANLCAS